jgi:hypothetical protein
MDFEVLPGPSLPELTQYEAAAPDPFFREAPAVSHQRG